MSAEPTPAPRSPLARSKGKRAGILAVTAAAGGAVVATVILNPFASSTAQAADELTRFADCDALAEHMRNLAYERLRRGDVYYGDDVDASNGAVVEDGVGRAVPQAGEPARVADGTVEAGEAQSETTADAALAPKAASPADAVGPGQTGTNTQEAGVDEADLAKTDGRLLVTIADGALSVMDVSGDTPRKRGFVELPGQKPLELLLSGDRAIVIGNAEDAGKFGIRPSEANGRFGGGTSYGIDSTTISVIDLSDPDRPLVRSSEEVTARYLSARMVDDTVRLVFSSTPDALRRFNGRGADVLRDGLAGSVAQDWLPTRRTVDRDARTVSESPLLDCSDVRYPSVDSGLDLVTVLSLDAGDGDLGSAISTAVVGSGDLVYASADRLFVATTDGGWGGRDVAFGGPEGDVRFAPDISRRTTVTRIHSFDITGAGADYLASGTVEGYLYGRWAMSEREGLLRVVTTATAPWNGRSGGATETGVSVLETVGSRMRVIGAIGNMGLTETVRSVRWFDEVAAIVTFRQTDPLYLVDLSNPLTPRVRGELKIPGYSAYLHPIGDHRLLGVGQDNGLQVSSFDILDLVDPRRTDVESFGNGTSSPVETDPRGFVYLPDQGLAVLPMVVPNYKYYGGPVVRTVPGLPRGLAFGENERGNSSSGLIAIQVAENGDLRLVASWGGTNGRDVVKVLPLPDGRLAALDTAGVTILKADGLRPTGSTQFQRQVPTR